MGDFVTVQIRLQGVSADLSGASFQLNYPTNALRLVSAQSARSGSLVPSTAAVTLWNVEPEQFDFALQNGTVLAAISSPSAWPTNNGVLAEFTFQVQAGQSAQYQWPVQLSKVELSNNGYDMLSLSDAAAYFIGRDPIVPSFTGGAAAFTPEGLKLTLTVDAGLSYTIEVSSDLKAWAPLKTLNATSGTLTFVDSEANNETQRFYRAVQQPALTSQPQ
jgi:hypothetical protein